MQLIYSVPKTFPPLNGVGGEEGKGKLNPTEDFLGFVVLPFGLSEIPKLVQSRRLELNQQPISFKHRIC